MVGQDAVSTTTAMLEKLLQIILEVIKMEREKAKNNKQDPINVKKKTPKIKFGEMKKSEYKKMLNAGEKMRRLELDKSKLPEINEIAKELGAKYWVMNTDGNNATLIVPEKYIAQLDDAIKEANKRQLSKTPEAFKVHDGKELIPEENIELVKNVLSFHDIPSVSFKTDNGYMNVVSSDFEGRYQAALKEAEQLKNELSAVDITVFNQTVPFEYLDKLDTKVMVLDADTAEYIAANVSGTELIKAENGTTAVRYSASAEERVHACVDNYVKDYNIAQDYLITVVDSTITINKEKLLISENNAEYFTKVPNSAGEDYIKIPKNDAVLIDGGKTISAQLDYNKTYQIFDKEGNLKSEMPGRELAARYNTKSRNADKNTAVFSYNSAIERIELYNAKENKLICVDIEDASSIRRYLMEQGLTSFAADKLLSDINKALPEQYKAVFNYVPTRSVAEYIPIKTELLVQYQLAEKIKSAILMDGQKDTLGNKCCILDKNTMQYVIVPAKSERLKEALEKMGYDTLKANIITSAAEKTYTASGATLEREDLHISSFETDNAELKAFNFSADAHGVILIKQEIDDKGELSVKYADISKEASRSDVEQALKNQFGIKDTASIAELMSCMDKKQLLPEAPSVDTREGFTIAKVSSQHIQVTKGGTAILIDKNSNDTQKLCNAFGLTEKQAEKFMGNIDKSLKSAVNKKGQSLNEIKKAAKKAYEKLSAEKKVQTAEKDISAAFDRS